MLTKKLFVVSKTRQLNVKAISVEQTLLCLFLQTVPICGL